MIYSAALATSQPPDTTFYMIIAYGVIFLMTCAYLTSLAIRWHRLQVYLKRTLSDVNHTGEQTASVGGEPFD